MVYCQKGKQRTEPQKQKTCLHRQNYQRKPEILAHMQAELHLHRTHSKMQGKKTEKAQTSCFAIFLTQQAQRDQHSNGKTPKEAHKQAKQNQANTHTIEPVQRKFFLAVSKN